MNGGNFWTCWRKWKEEQRIIIFISTVDGVYLSLELVLELLTVLFGVTFTSGKIGLEEVLAGFRDGCFLLLYIGEKEKDWNYSPVQQTGVNPVLIVRQITNRFLIGAVSSSSWNKSDPILDVVAFLAVSSTLPLFYTIYALNLFQLLIPSSSNVPKLFFLKVQ